MTLFEKAARLKLRFDSPKGSLTVEDLWDLPLSSTRVSIANLNDIAKGISRTLKETDEDFVGVATSADTLLQLKLDIVKHVIAVRKEEAESAKQAAEKREKKDRLLELIARKQDAALEGKSLEELQAMVAEL